MKKDWVVWVGCFCLFGIGAIWAGIPIGNSFFVVPNIHDLFEIFSSIATVLAVCVAYSTVDVWRRQISAQADLELARKFAYELLKFKEMTVSAFWDARLCVSMVPVGEDSIPDFMWPKVREDLEKRESMRMEQRIQFQEVLMRSKAIWGNGFAREFDSLLTFERNCDQGISMFVSFWAPNLEEHNILLEKQMRALSDYFKENDWTSGEAGKIFQKISTLSERGEMKLKRKL